MQTLRAGAAAVNISPRRPLFLAGYPNGERISTGVHDPLLSSALWLDDGTRAVIFVANDVIFIPKALAHRARQRIAKQTGVPAGNIMITATHTHSGPVTVDRQPRPPASVVPPPDAQFLAELEDGIVRAACAAHRQARPAEIGLAVADGAAVGTNRRNPLGPANPRVPVLLVRGAADHVPLALMLVCSMHPTVLHEDSKLVSADFPGMTRQYLQQHVVGEDCPVLHHTGAAGNQSPRHVTRGNTFAEAERLGALLGAAIAQAVAAVEFHRDLPLAVGSAEVDLPRQQFPAVPEAEADERRAFERLEAMRRNGEPRAAVRTAECDWFGAVRRAGLARLAAGGRLEELAAVCLPAEIQVICIGQWAFVGWPGEFFVEFALDLSRAQPNAHVIAYANGETNGYLVTAEAVAEGGYEAANAIFLSPASGERVVAQSRELLAQLRLVKVT
ncbi:MAG: hypothetical protein PCFJNLEI_02071 [Verrucomicrobiae bacterium]|nr:hypothetical protein [Verrucomicrobiae bacterium]